MLFIDKDKQEKQWKETMKRATEFEIPKNYCDSYIIMGWCEYYINNLILSSFSLCNNKAYEIILWINDKDDKYEH